MSTPVPVVYRTRVPVPSEELFAWHARPGAFMRLTPPWTDVTLERFEGIRDGQRAVIRLGAGPFFLRWVAEHHHYAEGLQFCDRQIRGPFRSWDHVHRMEADGPSAAVLHDEIAYRLPLGRLGHLVAGRGARRAVDRMFAYRHRITGNDLVLHRRYRGERPLRIAVTGASGLIGSSLTAFLQTGGHEVLRLVRRHPTAPGEIYWDPAAGVIDSGPLEDLDAVVHLAGENVAALRWTAAKKTRLYRSRVDGTRLLSTALARLASPPRVFLSASGIAAYGSRGDEQLTETSATATHGFLTSLVHDWEAATAPAMEAGIRTVHLRIGLVLSPRSGALSVLQWPFRIGLGGRPAPAGQFVSWIALDDALGALYHALHTDDVAGPLNLTAPEPVTMDVFARTLGRVLCRPSWMPVPPALLRLTAGEMADETLLTGARVLPRRLFDSGYDFLFADLEEALRHQLGRSAFSTDSPPL